MDIIASHQSGLVEQLDIEAVALAGGPREAQSRAIVCHHVADMTGLSHGYALLSAHGALAIDAAVAAMERTARGTWWRLKRVERAALAERVAAFGATLRALDAERCAGLLMAYRLVATPGLSGEAARRLPPALRQSLGAVLGARGAADAASRRALFVAHAERAEALIGARLEAALAALGWPLAPRLVEPAVAALRIPLRAFERGDRRGWAASERRLRRSKRLPESFAANPAQAFFALQRTIAERRRRAADGGDLPPDDAVRLVA